MKASRPLPQKCLYVGSARICAADGFASGEPATVRGRLIGAIEAKQREKQGEWKRNDRLLAVACHAQTHDGIGSVKDLRPHLLEEIKAFFIEYNKLRGRQFKPQAVIGPGKATKLLKAGIKAFAAQKKSSATP